MRRLLALIVLISSTAFGADAPDLRAAELAHQRQLLEMQLLNARLSFENAQLKLEKVEAQEKALKEEMEKAAKEKTK